MFGDKCHCYHQKITNSESDMPHPPISYAEGYKYWQDYVGDTSVTYARCKKCYATIGRMSKDHFVFDGIMLCGECFIKLDKEQQCNSQ